MTPDTARAQMSFSLSALTPAFLLNKFVWEVFQLWLWNLIVVARWSVKTMNLHPKYWNKLVAEEYSANIELHLCWWSTRKPNICNSCFHLASSLINDLSFQKDWSNIHLLKMFFCIYCSILMPGVTSVAVVLFTLKDFKKNTKLCTKIMHRKTVPHVQTKCKHLHYLKLLSIITFCVFCDFNIYIYWSKASVILSLWRALTHVNACIPHCVLICCYFFYSIIFVRRFCWKQKHVK